MSIEEMSPRGPDVTHINIPEKKQLEPLETYVPNGLENKPTGTAPLPPISQIYK